WLGFDGAAVEKNAAAHLECGIERAANRGEQARFSRPARPHDGDDLTRLERERKPKEHAMFQRNRHAVEHETFAGEVLGGKRLAHFVSCIYHKPSSAPKPALPILALSSRIAQRPAVAEQEGRHDQGHGEAAEGQDPPQPRKNPPPPAGRPQPRGRRLPSSPWRSAR